MALDIAVWHFHELVGHDGSEIIFPNLPEPQCRRGFHVSEACLAAIRQGYAATPVELMPVIASSPGIEPLTHRVFYGTDESDNWSRFTELLHYGQGVIECRTRSGNYHAVGYESGVIYDPDGHEFDYSRAVCEGHGLFTTRLWQIEKAR